MGMFNKPQEIPSVTAVPALVDTSVIIDGRIVDIAKAGFAPGKLLVPRFVLAELQLIADSGDAMKRSRGRRGLEMLHTMKEMGVDLEILDDDFPDIKEVDAKLVRLGRQMSCNVLTTDYNLNRVASIEGVRVLNINELANAVRPVIIPGERMHTKIVQSGKEKNQGVGYLADGTMIVVDNADKLIGADVEVEITRVFQTVAGKMLFAQLVGNPQPVAHKPEKQPQQQKPRRDKGPQGRRDGRGGDQQQKRGQRPDQPQAAQQSQPKAQQGGGQSKRQAGSGGNGGAGRRPKRLSPTQKLENSLVQLTGGEDGSDNQQPS